MNSKTEYFTSKSKYVFNEIETNNEIETRAYRLLD